jgi:hypothetical protein
MRIHPITVLLLGSMTAVIIGLLVVGKNKSVPSVPVVAVVPSSPPAAEASTEVTTSAPIQQVEASFSPVPIEQTNVVARYERSPVAAPPPTGDPLNDMLKLGQLWSSNNPAVLAQIFPYLTNSNPDVRDMAIEAVKQVGDHSTAPLLQKMAAATDDQDLRGALEEAATFLATPTLTEAESQMLPREHRLAANGSPAPGLPSQNQPTPNANAGNGGN